jgi:hypothetical protein
MIVFKIFFIAILILFLIFLWLTVNTLNKPIYDNKKHIWEDDKSFRDLSNVAIAFMLMIVFYLGYLFG